MHRSARDRGRGHVRASTFLLAVSVVGVSMTSPLALAAPVPSISVNDVSVTEVDAGTVTVAFTVVQDRRGKSSVHYSTVNDSATAPSDYLSRSGQLKFAGGHRRNRVAITIVGDTLDEANETFLLRLSAPVGATIADHEGTATITDNDPPPSVSTVASLTVPEGNGGASTFASVDVTLSAPSGRQVSVDYATADGTATAGSDFDADSGTVVFTPGQTLRSVVVQVTGDDDPEGDEIFDVELMNPVNATLGTHPAVITIQDNDPIPPGSAVLSVGGAGIREGNSGTRTLVFTVTRSGNTTPAVDVDFFTTNGTALAPSDYGSLSGDVSFASMETTKTIAVPVKGDRRLELRERFFLSLVNPSAGAAVDVGQATGFIRNDDSRITLTVTKGAERIRARGRLSPAHPRRRVAVTLFRRRNGVWVRISRKRPLLVGASDLNGDGIKDSRYAVRFARPNAARCRIVARFPGDATHGPSRATRLFPC